MKYLFNFSVVKKLCNKYDKELNSEELGNYEVTATSEKAARSRIINRVFGVAHSGGKHYINDNLYEELDIKKLSEKEVHITTYIQPSRRMYGFTLRKKSNNKETLVWYRGENEEDALDTMILIDYKRLFEFYTIVKVQELSIDEYKEMVQKEKEEAERSLAEKILQEEKYRESHPTIFDYM